jgi:hypothetical protein
MLNQHKQLEPEESLLNKGSCLAPALGVAKLIIVRDIIWSLFVVLLKSDLDALPWVC